MATAPPLLPLLRAPPPHMHTHTRTLALHSLSLLQQLSSALRGCYFLSVVLRAPGPHPVSGSPLPLLLLQLFMQMLYLAIQTR